jgi:hypothetical protein
MPKAKPVSLFPLTFEQAIDALIHAAPRPKPSKQRRKRKAKRKK